MSEAVSIVSPGSFEVGQSVAPPLDHRPATVHVVHLAEDLQCTLLGLKKGERSCGDKDDERTTINLERRVRVVRVDDVDATGDLWHH